jgi:hypothetical protein
MEILNFRTKGRLKGMSKKKIGILCEQFFTQDGKKCLFGGGERWFFDFVQLLKNNDYDVNCFQFSHDNWVKRYKTLSITGLGNITDKTRALVSDFKDGLKLFREKNKNSDGYFFLSQTLCMEKEDVPVLSVSHGITFDGSEFNQPKSSANSIASLDLYKKWLRNTTKCISVDTNSIKIAQVYCYKLANKFDYVPNYVDLDKFKPVSKKDNGKFSVLFPRRLQWCRGYRTMINAADILLQKYNDIEFIFCGRGGEQEEKEFTDWKINKDDRVKHMWYDMSEMHKVYELADISCVPTIRAEGTKGIVANPNVVRAKLNIKEFWDNNITPQWIKAKEVDIEDVVVFPKIKANYINDVISLDILDFVKNKNLKYNKTEIWSRYSNQQYQLTGREIAKKFNVKINIVYDTLEKINNNKKMKNIHLELKKYLIDNNVCFSKKINRIINVTPELLRLFGYYIAEGNSVPKKRGSIQFSFHDNEKDYHNDVLFLMKKYFGIDGKVKSVKTSLCTKVMFYNVIVAELFENLFDKGAYNKKIPQFIFELNNEYLIELLKGLFWGDGHYIYKSNSLGYTTASETLKEQIFQILIKFGIFAQTKKRIHSESSVTWQIFITGEKAIYMSKKLNMYKKK